MSERDRFDDESWRTLVEAPLSGAMAILSAGKPGPVGLFKEVRALQRTSKHPSDDSPLVRELAKASRSRKAQQELNRRLGSPSSKEAMASAAMPGLRAAAVTIATLSPQEADAVVGFVLEMCRAAAQAATDRGDSDPVSASEQEMLETIEKTLRGG